MAIFQTCVSEMFVQNLLLNTLAHCSTKSLEASYLNSRTCPHIISDFGQMKRCFWKTYLSHSNQEKMQDSSSF